MNKKILEELFQELQDYIFGEHQHTIKTIDGEFVDTNRPFIDSLEFEKDLKIMKKDYFKKYL